MAAETSQDEKEEESVQPSPLTSDSTESESSDVTRSATTDDSKNAFKRTLQRWGWTPNTARYDPNNPPKFTLALNLLFAIATTFTVANLYYNQAILNKIAENFDVSFEKASSVATLMQAGYASGLLFICPLGDIFRRRPFIIGLIAFTATLWLGLCLTNSFSVFAAISFICGATTVTPQLMLPLVGDLAPPHRRASSLAVVVSGLALGMLIARVLAGVVADHTPWRNIYWVGLAAQWAVCALLFAFMPDYPSKNPDGLNYLAMLWSVVRMPVAEPLLAQACVISFLISAVFTSYWTTLSFLLSGPPYEYAPVDVGLFGLIGVVVILLGPVYGRLIIDKVVPLTSAIFGLAVELAGVAFGTFTSDVTVAGPVVQAITIDIGSQFAQIANRAAIYNIRPDARNRVNTAYMLAAFVGQLTGTAVGNRLYAEGGWRYSGGCSIAFIGFALVVCVVRGPRETGWFGWSGGWRIRRDDLRPKKQETPTESALEDATGGIDERG